MIAVKTKGGMRFVTPSSKKSSLGASGGVSARPAATVQPTETRTTTTASTPAAAAAAAARGNKQSATVAPTSQLAKVMMTYY